MRFLRENKEGRGKMVVFLRYLLLAFLVLIPALFLYLLYQRSLLRKKRKSGSLGKDKDEAALSERLRTLVFLFILVIILIVVLSSVA